MTDILQQLSERGVTVHAPASQWITVSPEQIASGVTIYPGCRISGDETSIGPGCVLGQEGPVTIENCQLGHKVTLKGGYFAGTTFLDGAEFGSSAHVRPGCLLEEQANAAHCVGIKQTILLPFVTLGSLINFCDCLMAGGTSRKDHSEVGSSYIHFNFTPHQDKATPSLFGEIPRGVLLNQKPIFLGGQGGTVGPVHTEYGTIVGAGSVLRTSITDENKLVIPKALRGMTLEYPIGAYGALRAIVEQNLNYIGNITALLVWHQGIRSLATTDSWQKAALAGARKRLQEVRAERIKRLGALAASMPDSIAKNIDLGKSPDEASLVYQRHLGEQWPRLSDELARLGSAEVLDEAIAKAPTKLTSALTGTSHIEGVQGLSTEVAEQAQGWLETIVESHSSLAELW